MTGRGSSDRCQLEGCHAKANVSCRTSGDRRTPANVCEGGAWAHPPGGATGGAEMTFREGISPSTPPEGRASSVSPRYRPNVLTHSLNKASQRNLGALCVRGACLRLDRAVPEFAGASRAEPSSPGHPPVDRGSSACPPPLEPGVPADQGGITGRILVPGALAIGPLRPRPRRMPLPHAA